MKDGMVRVEDAWWVRGGGWREGNKVEEENSIADLRSGPEH